jgi:hypothetical protein
MLVFLLALQRSQPVVVVGYTETLPQLANLLNFPGIGPHEQQKHVRLRLDEPW